MFLDMHQPAVVSIDEIRIRQHQGSISLNAHQKIVEIVGDAPGKGTDGLHFLGLI